MSKCRLRVIPSRSIVAPATTGSGGKSDGIGSISDIAAAVRRLTGAQEMGGLFKALALTRPDLGAPPGFD